MTQQEIKANLPPLPLISDHKRMIITANQGEHVLYGDSDHFNIATSTATQHAIVSAINNTYGKGINPESVPDMYNVLQMVVDELDGCNMSLTAKIIKDILNKATL